jgi:hypothetical protein
MLRAANPGHHAHDVQAKTPMRAPDRVIERIADLLRLKLSDFQVRP